MSVVLDASVLVAFLPDESGSPVVPRALEGALVSSANFEPFSSCHAEIAARLGPDARTQGLFLADRACLALGIDRNLPILAADRAWRKPGLDLKIRVVPVR